MDSRDSLTARRNEIQIEKKGLAINILQGGYDTGKLLEEFARTENKTFPDLAAYMLAAWFTATPADEDLRRLRALSQEEKAIDFWLNLLPPSPAPRRKHRRRGRRKF